MVFSVLRRSFICLLVFISLLSACGGGSSGQSDLPSGNSQPAPITTPPAPIPEIPFEAGQRMQLDNFSSVNTGGTYPVKLYLPANMDSSLTYPVIYSFDAEWIFDDIADALDELELRVILVGVQNDVNDPPTYAIRESYATWPLVEDYFYFVRDELSPFIEGRYPVATDNRTLIGHSFLGLFVNYAYLLDDDTLPWFSTFISLDGTVIGSAAQLQENLGSRVAQSSTITQKLILVTATGTGGNFVSVTWLYNQIVAAGFEEVDVALLSYDVGHREVIVPSLADVLSLAYPSN